MDSGKISYSRDFRIGICRSFASSQEEGNNTHHFITKVMESLLRVDGASYAFCHYNGNLPTREGSGMWCARNSLTCYFVYKPIIMTP